MAAVYVATPTVEGAHEKGSLHHRRHTQWKIGSDDKSKTMGNSSIYSSESARRCDSAIETCRSTEMPPPSDSNSHSITTTKTVALIAEILRLIDNTPGPYGTPPPPYHETFVDCPPSYSTIEALASAFVNAGSSAPAHQYAATSSNSDGLTPFQGTMDASLDWGSTAGIKMSGNAKKQKKAAKKAQQDKWANSDNEGENNAGEDAEGGEGGGDGGNAGGDGGDPGDGGGGNDDGDDDWNFGGGKKGKKNKKKAKQEEEERKKQEEERKKQEEEEAKKKAEEEAAAANSNTGNPLSWADDANPNDEWGGFTVSKNKKKGKKGKVTEDAPPIPPPPPEPPAASTFHEINLDDDVPNLDFSFGNEGHSKGKEGNAFSNNFSGWGSSWDFGAVDKTKSTQQTDDKTGKAKGASDGLGDNNPWSLNNKSKNKKSNVAGGFDFGDFGTSTGLDDLGLGTTSEDKSTDNNAWGFASVGKGKKGKKGKDTTEDTKEPNDVTALPEVEKPAEDIWGTWGTKKDKKKNKKAEADENTSQIPPPPPAAPAPPEAEHADEWASFGFGNKKDKKNKKKGSADDAGPVKIEESAQTAPGSESALDWAAGASKKDKKKKKGGLISEIEEEPSAPDPHPAPDTNDANDDGWMASAWGKPKKDKKGKKGAVSIEPATAPESTTIGDTTATSSTAVAEDDWSAWGTAGTKKEKKGKKGANDTKNEIPPPPPPPPPEPENSTVDDTWASLGTKNNKKGAKKGKNEPDPEIVTSPDPDVQGGEDDIWSNFGTKKDKKAGAKKAKNEPEFIAPIAPEPEANKTGDDIWGSFGSKKDKKGAKKGKIEAETTPAPPETEAKDIDDIWGSFGSKAGKKNAKKGKSDTAEDVLTSALDPKLKEEDDIWNFGKKDAKGIKKGRNTESEAVPHVADALQEEKPETDTWGGWGLTAKEKKKKEKEAKKKGPDTLTEEPSMPAPGSGPPAIPDVDDLWGAWTTNDTKKKGKKGRLSEEPPPPAPTPPKQGLTPEPTDLDDFIGDTWADLTESKSKGSTKKGSLSRTTTSASKGGKGVEKASTADKSDFKISPKEEKANKDDSAAQAVKSMWGGFGGSTTVAKTKLVKEKEEKAKKEAEKAEAEARAAMEAETAAAAAAALLVEPKKGAKAKTGKLSKVDSKGSNATEAGKKKGVEDGLIDLLESPSEEKTGLKVKKTASPKEEKPSKPDVFAMWGGTTAGKNLKTTGKKGEKVEEPKGEIKRQGSTNQKSALAGLAKELESPIADETSPPTTQPSTNKSAAKAMQSATIKSLSSKAGAGAGVSSSVAARIKALEGKDELDPKKKKVDASASLAKDSPAALTPDPPKEEKRTLKNSKGATTTTTTAAKGKKKDSPLEEKASKDFVPGSFPGAFGDDDDDDLLDLAEPIAPSPEKKMKKGTTTTTTTKKSAAGPGRKAKLENNPIEMPEAPEPPKLPTPPPEEKKPVKKERARVERTGAASSWGFWGAAPKKDVKKTSSLQVKDDGDVAAPVPKKEKSPPGLARSKSNKTAKQKEKNDLRDAEKTSRSSGSAGGREKGAPSRPSTNRGKGLSSFLMGGAPPSATRPKTARRSSTTGTSKSASRRQSMDVDASGMISPPPDDEPEVGGKAAKIMGVGATKSTKGKGKAKAVPDPYAIDDDDMVMVNPIEDPIVNGMSSKNPPPKDTKTSKAKPKTKREVSNKNPKPISPPPKSSLWSTEPIVRQNDLDGSRPSWGKNFTRVEANGKIYYQQPNSKATDLQDDTVMIDAGGEPLVTSGPDDIAFVDHAPPSVPLKRSNTSSKRTSGIFGGLFGGGGSSAPPRNRGMSVSDRPKSSYYDTDAVVEPSRSSRDKPKRRSTYRSNREKETDAEGFTTDAAGATTEAEDPEAAEARRAERKAKREAREQAAREAEAAEQREREERRARRKEKERAELEARRAKAREIRRREQEAEDQRREDKRARRREKEERRAREEEEAAASAEASREERRQLREKLEAEQGVSTNRSKAERRKSYAMEEEERLRRRDTRKSEKSSRRKSMMPGPVDDYFDPRNGGTSGPAEPALHGAPPDKTSSWVNDLADNPPDVPPVEGTVLEDPPTERVSDERRARRESRRHSKYAGLTEAEIEERRRRKRDARREEREKEKSVSGGSREDGDVLNGDRDRDRRRKTARRRDTEEDYDAYMEGGPVKTFDGRPVMGGKRNSWFSKLKGF